MRNMTRAIIVDFNNPSQSETRWYRVEYYDRDKWVAHSEWDNESRAVDDALRCESFGSYARVVKVAEKIVPTQHDLTLSAPLTPGERELLDSLIAGSSDA